MIPEHQTGKKKKKWGEVGKKPTKKYEKEIENRLPQFFLFVFVFFFYFFYFFDGLPNVPYEFLFPELEPELGMSLLLLGRGKVNDSPTPSRGFQMGDPNGLAAAGAYD